MCLYLLSFSPRVHEALGYNRRVTIVHESECLGRISIVGPLYERIDRVVPPKNLSPFDFFSSERIIGKRYVLTLDENLFVFYELPIINSTRSKKVMNMTEWIVIHITDNTDRSNACKCICIIRSLSMLFRTICNWLINNKGKTYLFTNTFKD